jgi:hypothetical protein
MMDVERAEKDFAPGMLSRIVLNPSSTTVITYWMMR